MLNFHTSRRAHRLDHTPRYYQYRRGVFILAHILSNGVIQTCDLHCHGTAHAQPCAESARRLLLTQNDVESYTETTILPHAREWRWRTKIITKYYLQLPSGQYGWQVFANGCEINAIDNMSLTIQIELNILPDDNPCGYRVRLGGR